MDKIRPPFQASGLGERVKKKKWRSGLYLAWIRDRPCSKCSQSAPSEPHHLRKLSLDASAASTSHDCCTVSLCRECHINVQTHARAYRHDEYKWLAHTLVDAVVDGVLVIA